jgi:hypothetical protein
LTDMKTAEYQIPATLAKRVLVSFQEPK